MTDVLEQIYLVLSEEVDNDPEYRKKWRATKDASLAILDELERRCGENCRDLLDVKLSLDAQKHELHEQALFRLAVKFGMELGCMGA